MTVDRLGQEIVVDNMVAFTSVSWLWVGRVVKITAKGMMIRYTRKYIDEQGVEYETESETTCFKTADEVIKLSGEDVLAYALKKGL
jgi:hypothetical protein